MGKCVSENMLKKTQGLVGFQQARCQELSHLIAATYENRGTRKKGGPQNANISVDVYENKGQNFSHRVFESMLMKAKDLFGSENISLKTNGLPNLQPTHRLP